MPFSSNPTIEILLATYNGESFLPDLLDSLLHQTFSDWKCTISDDGSTDCTMEIIKEYSSKHPGRFSSLKLKNKNLGPSMNFGGLLSASAGEYIMFCDQDDVWLPDKIEKTWNKMKELERTFGVSTPLLVHTDLLPVNEHLQPLTNSFWKYQNLNPNFSCVFSRLLVQNCVSGCTILMNRAACQICDPIPSEAIMHDWWIALCVSAFGHINTLNQPTVLYRQHGGNQIGAQKWKWSTILHKINSLQEARKSFQKTRQQAMAFSKRFAYRKSKEVRIAHDYAKINNLGLMQRRIFLVKNRILKTGILRNIGLFVIA